MRILKQIFAIMTIFTLLVPVNVNAEEHQHDLIPGATEVYTTPSDSYCLVITYVTTMECACGYKIVTENTEYNPHQWELVCVDQNNNGYMKTCATCGCTSGGVIYPMAIGVVEEKY